MQAIECHSLRDTSIVPICRSVNISVEKGTYLMDILSNVSDRANRHVLCGDFNHPELAWKS